MTAQTKSQSSYKFQFVGDAANASFRHDITIEQSHRYGQMKSSGTILKGYSKHKGHDEPLNKLECFEKYMIRIVTSYHYKSECIEFYSNNREGAENDELICAVNKYGYFIHPNYRLDSIIRLLEKAKAGNLPQVAKEGKTVTKTKQELFIYEKGHFKSLTQFEAYCDKLVSEHNISFLRAQGYYMSAKEIFGF